MDKKTKLLSLLLIVVIVVTATYVVINQPNLDDNQQNYFPDDGDVTDQDISNEIDDFFIYEDDEVEIGEMI